jgi:hypothetical protein
MISKFLACFGLTTSLCLMAQAVPDAMGGWGNLTALGILGIVIVMVITRILPDLHDKFTQQTRIHEEESTRRTAAFLESLDEIRKQHHEDSKILAESLGKMSLRPCQLETIPLLPLRS